MNEILEEEIRSKIDFKELALKIKIEAERNDNHIVSIQDVDYLIYQEEYYINNYIEDDDEMSVDEIDEHNMQLEENINNILDDELVKQGMDLREYRGIYGWDYVSNVVEIDDIEYMFDEDDEKEAKIQKIVLDIVKDWDIISKSPYSNSIYDSDCISWGYKPEGSLRISDHWSFESQGKIHCKIEDETKKNHWLLCRYENGIYKIIRDISKEISEKTDK